MEQKKKKYSYIRRSYARNGIGSLFLAILAFCLLVAAVIMTVSNMGQAGLNAGAVGLSSMVMALMSLWFARLGFLEKNRSPLLAGIGASLSGLLLLFWIGILIAGARL